MNGRWHKSAHNSIEHGQCPINHSLWYLYILIPNFHTCSNCEHVPGGQEHAGPAHETSICLVRSPHANWILAQMPSQL